MKSSVGAKDAAAILQKIGRQSESLKASHLLNIGYVVPDVNEAKLRLAEQSRRISLNHELNSRKLELELDLAGRFQTVQPPQTDIAVVELVLINIRINALSYEGRIHELKLETEFRNEVRKRDEELITHKAQASSLVTFIMDNVDQKTKSKIDAILDMHKDNPGDKAKAVMIIVKEDIMGDQDYEREKIVSMVKNIQPANREEELGEKIDAIREGIMRYNRSMSAEGKAGLFDQALALKMLEKISLAIPTAMTIIRECKKTDPNMAFDIVEKAIVKELERVSNLRDSHGSKEDAAEVYRKDNDASTFAMGANSGGGRFVNGSSSSNVCYQYQNGNCLRGETCRFSHVMQQQPQLQKQQQYPHQQPFSSHLQQEQRRGNERGGGDYGNRGREVAARREDRGRDPDRSREGDRDRDVRDRSRESPQDRGGGGRDQDRFRVQASGRGGILPPTRRDDRGGGGRGDRGGERSRSGSPSSRSRSSYGSTPRQSPEKALRDRPATPLQPRGEKDKPKENSR